MSKTRISNTTMTGKGIIIGDKNEQQISLRTQIVNNLPEIERLIERMWEFIDHSNELTDEPKKHALEQVDILKQAIQQPDVESKSAAGGAVKALETVCKFLPPAGKLVAEMNTLLPSLAKLLGV